MHAGVPHGVWRRCLRRCAAEPACLLVSYTASPERGAKAQAGLDDQAKGTKVVHRDGTNQITIDQSLTYC